MPVYVFDVTVPAATPVDAPAEQIFYLPVGVLSRLQVFFPPGPQGEVRVRMLLNGTQVYPSQTGQWVAWDAGAVDSDLDVAVPYGENQVKVQVCAPNANFSHVVTIKLDTSYLTSYDGGTITFDAMNRTVRVLGGE